MARERRYLTTTITSHTLLGGDDNPNCFSLLSIGSPYSRSDLLGGRVRDVRIVNMNMGPFERVRAEHLTDGKVEVEMLDDHSAIITDPRVPEHELHNGRWCGVCCRFHLLPEEQQRARLKRETPNIRGGTLTSWSMSLDAEAKENTPEQVEEYLRELKAIGAA